MLPLTLLTLEYSRHEDALGDCLRIGRGYGATLTDVRNRNTATARLFEKAVPEFMGRPLGAAAVVGSYRLNDCSAVATLVRRVQASITQYGSTTKRTVSARLQQVLLPALWSLPPGDIVEFTWTREPAVGGREAEHTFHARLTPTAAAEEDKGSELVPQGGGVIGLADPAKKIPREARPSSGSGNGTADALRAGSTQPAPTLAEDTKPVIVRVDYTKHPSGTWDVRAQYMIDVAAALPDRRQDSERFDTGVRTALRLLIPGTPETVDSQTFIAQGRTEDMLTRHIQWFESHPKIGKDNRLRFSERERFVQFLYGELLRDMQKPQRVRAYFRYDGIAESLGLRLRFGNWEEVGATVESTRAEAGQTALIQAEAAGGEAPDQVPSPPTAPSLPADEKPTGSVTPRRRGAGQTALIGEESTPEEVPGAGPTREGLRLLTIEYSRQSDALGDYLSIRRGAGATRAAVRHEDAAVARLLGKALPEFIGRPSNPAAGVSSHRLNDSSTVETLVNRIQDAITQHGSATKHRVSNDVRQVLLPALRSLSGEDEVEFTWTWEPAVVGPDATHTFHAKLVSPTSPPARQERKAAELEPRASSPVGPARSARKTPKASPATEVVSGDSGTKAPDGRNPQQAPTPAEDTKPVIVRVDYTKHPDGTWDVRAEYIAEVAAAIPRRGRDSKAFDGAVRSALRFLIPGKARTENGHTVVGRRRTEAMLMRHISWFEEAPDVGDFNRQRFGDTAPLLHFLYDHLVRDVAQTQSFRVHLRYDGMGYLLGPHFQFDRWEEVADAAAPMREGAGHTALAQPEASAEKPLAGVPDGFVRAKGKTPAEKLRKASKPRVRVSFRDEAVEIERRQQTRLLAEEDRDGVTQHRAKPARPEMPRILHPHLLHSISLGQLTDDRLDATALLRQPARPKSRLPARFPLLLSLARLVGTQQTQTVVGALLAQPWRPVVPVTKRPAHTLRQQVFGDLHVGDVSRSQTEVHDHARPRDDQVNAQSVEGLLRHVVVSIRGVFPETATPLRASEPTDRHGEAVDDGDLWIRVDTRQDVLPQALLEVPQVRSLPSERRAMDRSERGEPRGVVTAEVVEDALVGINAEEGSHHFHGQHLAVVQPRTWSTGPHGLIPHPVVDETEDVHQERAKLHRETFHRDSCVVRFVHIGSEGLISASTPSRNLHTGSARTGQSPRSIPPYPRFAACRMILTSLSPAGPRKPVGTTVRATRWRTTRLREMAQGTRLCPCTTG